MTLTDRLKKHINEKRPESSEERLALKLAHEIVCREATQSGFQCLANSNQAELFDSALREAQYAIEAVRDSICKLKDQS